MILPPASIEAGMNRSSALTSLNSWSHSRIRVFESAGNRLDILQMGLRRARRTDLHCFDQGVQGTGKLLE
jgi:hypothetical protein